MWNAVRLLTFLLLDLTQGLFSPRFESYNFISQVLNLPIFRYLCDPFVGETRNHLRVLLTGQNLSIAHKEQQKPISEHSQLHKENV